MNDVSGNGETLINNNGVTFDNGKFDSCFNFGASNKSSSKTLEATGITYSMTSNWTMAFWGKILNQPSITYPTCAMFGWQNASNSRTFSLAYGYVGGAFSLRAFPSNSSEDDYEVVLPNGVYFYVECSHTGGVVKVRLNGQTVISSTLDSTSIGTTQLFLGTAPSGYSLAAMEGTIEQVALYNYYRTEQDCRRYYAWSLGRL